MFFKSRRVLIILGLLLFFSSLLIAVLSQRYYASSNPNGYQIYEGYKIWFKLEKYSDAYKIDKTDKYVRVYFRVNGESKTTREGKINSNNGKASIIINICTSESNGKQYTFLCMPIGTNKNYTKITDIAYGWATKDGNTYKLKGPLSIMKDPGTTTSKTDALFNEEGITVKYRENSNATTAASTTGTVVNSSANTETSSNSNTTAETTSSAEEKNTNTILTQPKVESTETLSKSNGGTVGLAVLIPHASDLSANCKAGVTATSQHFDYNCYISAILNYAAYIGLYLAVLMVIYAGYKYMTSEGNPTAVGEAKDILFGALIGYIMLYMIRLVLTVMSIKYNS